MEDPWGLLTAPGRRSMADPGVDARRPGPPATAGSVACILVEVTDPNASSNAFPDVLTVSTPAEARLLLNRGRARYLAPFIGRALSAGEAARELGEPLTATHPRVRRLHERGLLVLVDERPRAGRAAKIYRAAADEFFVPLDAVPPAPWLFATEYHWHAEYMRSLEREVLESLTRTAQPGVRLYRDDKGRVRIEGAAGPGRSWDPQDMRRPVQYEWDRIWLTPEQARSLVKELQDLRDRYLGSPSGDARPYLLGLHLAAAEAALEDG